jgi:hypothetical protein
MIRRLFALVMTCLSLPGVAASVLSYNAEHRYQKDKILPFPDFSLVLSGVKTNTFEVAGTMRQNVTEQFEIRLPDGRKILRELTNGFPGDISDQFGFRASRLRFFSVRALNGVLTVRETDQVTEKKPDGTGFLHFCQAKTGTGFLAGSGTVYVFPGFDFRVGTVRSESKSVRMSQQDIERWYQNARAAYEAMPYDSVATKQAMLKSLERSRTEMEKKPESTVVLRFVTLRFEPADGGKGTEMEVQMHEERASKFDMNGGTFEVKSRPSPDSPDQIQVRVDQK